MPDPSQIPYVNQIKRLTDIDAIRDVPVVGSLYNAANTVIDFAESDCHPDWSVYAETLWPALGQAVLVYLSFGLDDVLRGYFRPAGGRGFGGLGRASRRTRRLTRAQRARGLLRGGIPELGELLGRHLPGATVVKGRNVGNGERWLWRVDGIAQRGLWAWMVADILDDFTVNWTTALLESEECDCPDSAGARRTGGGFGVSGAAGWQGFPVPFLAESWGQHFTDAFGVTLDFGTTASVTMDGVPVRGTIFQDGIVNYRLLHVPSGAVAGATDWKKTPTELGGEATSMHAEIAHPGRWEWQCRTNGPSAIMTLPEVNVWISGCH